MFSDLNTYKKTYKTEIIKFLIKLHFNFINGFLKVLQNLLYNNKNLTKAKKILIFRTGSIGDSVCALPAINTIVMNFPEAQIDILTNAGGESLKDTGINSIIDKTIINEIIDYHGSTFWKLRKVINNKKYDILIQLPQSLTSLKRELKNLLIIKGLGFKNAMGFEINRVKIFAKWQEKLFFFENERERLLNMLERYEIKNYGMVYPIKKDVDVINKVKDILSQNGLENKERNICMVIGAKRAQNRWPINYFNEVAAYLQNKNFNILVIGNSEDREEAVKIKGSKVFNFCDELTLLESAELLRQCKLTISNDTGPMHLSYAVGTPVIAIFSSWQQPGLWEPPQDGKNIVLRNFNVHCSMCLIENCPDNICMQGIKPNNIIEILKQRIN